MSRLYGRKVQLQAGAELFDKLRIAFKVRRSLGKNPHPAEIQIYNLGAQSRAAFQAKGVKLILSAGYTEAFGQIWSGELRTVSHVKDKADWITKAAGGDGEKLIRSSRISKSYKAGTPIATVIRDVAKATGLGLGNLETALTTPFHGGLTQYANGTVVQGQATEQLYNILRAVGLNYSVQDGQLQVLADGESLPGTAFSFSASTGLVGSPEICEEGDGQKKRRVLKIKALMNHQIIPGCTIQVDAANKKGFYRVQTVTHTGDSHGSDWITDMECLV